MGVGGTIGCASPAATDAFRSTLVGDANIGGSGGERGVRQRSPVSEKERRAAATGTD
jgi:hypothetical protein